MKRALFLLAAVWCATSMLADSPGKLTIIIHHTSSGQPLDFARSGLTNTSCEQISLTRLAYLLSEPGLKATSDGEWVSSRNWFAFTDAAKGSAAQVMDGLPAETFNALRFHIGLDETTDRADPGTYPARHPLNPSVNGLHWGWAGGFVFLALEGHTSENEGFSYHLAGAKNRMEITLPIALDLRAATTIELDFHVDRLFDAVPNIAAQNSTHSRASDELPARIAAQAEQAFTIRAVHATEATTATNPRPRHEGAGTPYTLPIPRGVPVPDLPADFPLTQERVALGRRLFSDTRLSRNRAQSCASCHKAASAFADKRRFSAGTDGELGERNAMPLFNLAWKSQFFWDGRSPALRKQALDPIQNPIEMHARLEKVEDRLAADKSLANDFAKAFGTPGVSAERVGLALEAFLITLTSFDSRFDRAMRGEAQLTEEEKRGFQLFVTEYDPRQNQFGADCFHCHGGALFTDNQFHNNGLKSEGNDRGRARVTGCAADEAKFATPSLRNVALSAPYMHDGRFATLAEVVEHYDHGIVRGDTLDPNLAKHPVSGLALSAEDKRALVSFLQTLTDEHLASANRQ